MHDVFDANVLVTTQALERKARFNALKAQKNNKFEQNFQDALPTIWFDDFGEIQAVSYDESFVPDSAWTTYDFHPDTLKMIKGKTASCYLVQQTQDAQGKIAYRIVLKKNKNHRTLTQNHGLVLARKTSKEYMPDVTVEMLSDSMKITLQPSGRQKILSNEKRYQVDNQLEIFVTEPMNMHFLLETFKVDISDLLKGDVVVQTKNYMSKSIYGLSPLTYGRL